MDVAAERPQPPPPPDAPEIGGQRIAWGGRDVLIGILWFIGLFIVLPIPFVLPFITAGNTDSDGAFLTQFIFVAIAQVGIVVVAARLTFAKYGGSWERLGLRRPGRRELAWAGGALVASLVVAGLYAGVVEWLDIEALKTECAEQIPLEVRETRYLLAIAAFVVVALAPFCEEVFFRGFVFPGLVNTRSFPIAYVTLRGLRVVREVVRIDLTRLTTSQRMVIAVVVSALIFAVVHFLFKSFIPIAAVGMIFAYTYWRSGNLFSTIGAHLAFNSISIALIAAGTCDTDNGASAALGWWLQ